MHMRVMNTALVPTENISQGMTIVVWEKGKLTMNKFKLTYLEREVLVAFAKCNLKPSKASSMLHMCIASVDYHLNKIFDKTGIDPRTFFGCASLLNARNIYQDKACFIVYDGGNERIEFKEEQ
jgi:DNA-binding NarL/FixJ family response regulator